MASVGWCPNTGHLWMLCWASWCQSLSIRCSWTPPEATTTNKHPPPKKASKQTANKLKQCDPHRLRHRKAKTDILSNTTFTDSEHWRSAGNANGITVLVGCASGLSVTDLSVNRWAPHESLQTVAFCEQYWHAGRQGIKSWGLTNAGICSSWGVRWSKMPSKPCKESLFGDEIWCPLHQWMRTV